MNSQLKIEMCQCSHCLERLSLPSQDPWVVKFQKDLINGRLAHVGQDSKGRQLYRQT
jgi:hypothetical protein